MKKLLLILLLAPITLLAQTHHKAASGVGALSSQPKTSEDPANNANLAHLLSKSPEYKTLLAEIAAANKALDKQTAACKDAPDFRCLQEVRQAKALLDSLQSVDRHFQIDANRMLELFEANPKSSERMAKAAKAFEAGKIKAADAALDAAQIAQYGDAALRPNPGAHNGSTAQAANELTFKAYLQALDFQNPQRFQNVAKYALQGIKYAEIKDNLLDIGVLLLGHGEYDLGVPFLAKAMRFDLDQGQEAFLAATLADYYAEHNDPQASEAMFKRAAAVYVELAKADAEYYGAELADVLLGYGKLMANIEKYDRANELYLQAKLCAENLSNSNPKKVSTLINIHWQMGWVYEQDSKLGSALDMYAKAVDLSMHSKLATEDNRGYYQFKTLKQYAEACTRLEQLPTAIESYTRALPILERLAKEDPWYAPYLVEMVVAWAAVNETLGNEEEVERLYIYAINSCNRLGAGNGYMKQLWAENQMNLGNFYKIQHRLSDGLQCYEMGWPILRLMIAQAPETYAPDQARHGMNYAMLLRDMGRYTSADSLFQESNAVAEKLAAKAPETYKSLLAFGLGHHGLTLLYDDRPEEAEPLFRRSLKLYQAMDEAQPGSEYDYILWNHVCLGTCLGNQKKYVEAEEWFQKALVFAEAKEQKEPGKHALEIGSVIADLADCMADQGKYAAACEFAQRCLQVRIHAVAEAPETRDHAVAAGHNSLGYFQTLNRQLDEAAKELTLAMEGFQKLVLAGQKTAYNEFLRSYNNVHELRDSLEAQKAWSKVSAIQLSRAQLTEGLGNAYPDLDSLRASAYGALAWALLFEQKYAASLAASEKAFGFDATQNWIRTNWGHAYLLQGDWDNATKIYQIYLDAIADREVVGDALIEDWDRLEKEGLVPATMLPQVAKARAWLKEQVGEH